MAEIGKCIDVLEELKQLLSNKDCFEYQVMDCKKGEFLVDVVAKRNDNSEWNSDKVYTDIVSKIIGETVKIYDVSRIMKIDDVVINKIFIHTEGQRHLDIYIKLFWDRKAEKIII